MNKFKFTTGLKGYMEYLHKVYLEIGFEEEFIKEKLDSMEAKILEEMKSMGHTNFAATISEDGEYLQTY